MPARQLDFFPLLDAPPAVDAQFLRAAAELCNRIDRSILNEDRPIAWEYWRGLADHLSSRTFRSASTTIYYGNAFTYGENPGPAETKVRT